MGKNAGMLVGRGCECRDGCVPDRRWSSQGHGETPWWTRDADVDPMDSAGLIGSDW